MSKANEHQPAPILGQVDVIDLVRQDIDDRVQAGYEKYGTRLQTFNGRDALWDAYQEAIDLVMYLRQKIAENEEGREPELIATIRRASGLFDVHGNKWQRYPLFRHDGTQVNNDVEWMVEHIVSLLSSAARSFLLDHLDADLHLDGELRFQMVNPPFAILAGTVKIYR